MRCSAMDRSDIVSVARAWVGTPWRHQGRLKGHSCDCVGLLIGVARELDLGDYRKPYRRRPNVEEMRAALGEHLREIPQEDARGGDVLYLSFAGEPTHVGILSSPTMLIHAYQPVGRVVEHTIDGRWRKRIVAAYRFPGVY